MAKRKSAFAPTKEKDDKPWRTNGGTPPIVPEKEKKPSPWVMGEDRKEKKPTPWEMDETRKGGKITRKDGPSKKYDIGKIRTEGKKHKPWKDIPMPKGKGKALEEQIAQANRIGQRTNNQDRSLKNNVREIERAYRKANQSEHRKRYNQIRAAFGGKG